MPVRSSAFTPSQRAIFENSHLDILVPRSSDSCTDTLFKDASSKAATRDQQRSLLLYDEVVTFAVCLRVQGQKKILEQIARHVDVTVSAHVTSTGIPPEQHQGQTAEDHQVRFLLGTVTLSADSSEPNLYGNEDDTEAFAIWTAELHLRSPERQLYRPAVHFNASATAVDAVSEPVPDPEDEYMSSGIPQPENLLQQLQNSPAFAAANIQLPASRIQKVVPRSWSTTSDSRPVRVASRPFPIVPAIAIRPRLSSVVNDNFLSIDIEILRWASCAVHVDEIRSQIVENIKPLHDFGLPQSMQIGDRSNFVFRIPSEAIATPKVVIKAHLDISPGCRVHLDIERTPHLPHYNSATLRTSTTRHWQRPTSHPISRPTSVNAPDRGISFTTSAPPKVTQGSRFHIDVFVLNKSIKKRRLALIPMTDTQNARFAASRPGVQPLTAHLNGGREMAPAVIDHVTLYKMQQGRSRDQTQAQIVSLSADVKVGPLVPGACHSTQLDFIALSPGVVSLDGIMVLDLETRESVSLSELPDIVIFDEGKGI